MTDPTSTTSHPESVYLETARDLVEEVVRRSVDRESKFFRVLGPGADSGWLVAGDNPRESAKHHARKWHAGGEGFYFVAKYDRLEPEMRTADTPRPILGHPTPQPVWHRQREWRDDFPLPDDLWSGPAGSDPERPARTVPEIERDLLRGMLGQMSKGPRDLEHRVAGEFLRSSLADRER